MDSDEEFETGLPKVRPDEILAGKLNVSDLLAGNAQEMEFDVPEEVEIDGEQMKEPTGAKSSKTSNSILNRVTFEHMNLKFMSKCPDDALKVMFGDYSEIEALMENVTKDGGIKKRIVKVGTGKTVEKKHVAVMHYLIGAEPLDDLFESTYEHRRPKRFRVGNGEVIPAIDIGVVGMRVGEIAKFLATSKYGYGVLGVPSMTSEGGVPPDSRIMIQIEIVESYASENKDNAVLGLSPAERRQMPFAKGLGYVEEMKQEGNREFKYQNYETAIKSYLAALDVMQDLDPMTPEEKADYFKIRHQLCNNLSNVYYKIGRFHRALKYGEEGVDIPITGVLKAKSHYWCAKALYSLGRFELCFEHVRKADRMKSDNDIKKLKTEIDKKMNTIKEQEKLLCSKMMMMGV